MGTSSSAARRGALAALLAAALAGVSGCGGSGERQDANEPSGDYPVEITQVKFPPRQGYGETSRLVISVKNTGEEKIPNIAMTVNGFYYRTEQPNVADPARPVWILNLPPANGQTAMVNTWALGSLDPGRVATFVWNLTAVKSGNHRLDYRAAAGLNGKARAVTDTGGVPAGTIAVRVTPKPRKSYVLPNGEVVEKGE
ncbi:MAG: hypothetical protein ACKOH7_02845 [Solirubrobacterales bacterium]